MLSIIKNITAPIYYQGVIGVHIISTHRLSRVYNKKYLTLNMYYFSPHWWFVGNVHIALYPLIVSREGCAGNCLQTCWIGNFEKDYTIYI